MPFKALYIHVPFCRSRCKYCDFATSACHDRAAMDGYLEGLLTIVGACAEGGLMDAVETAYVGGGTPSYLGAEGLARLIGAVRSACPRVRELSFEANPDSITPGLLAAAKGAGATRISIGVQSFHDAELKALGRVHDSAKARKAVDEAVGAGLSVSVDLMCGVWGQTAASVAESVATAVGLGADHVSCYPLIIEEGTAFGRACDEGRLPWPSEDEAADQMEAAERVLTDAGLSRYEVASYARPGKACAHNVAYWTGVAYLGIGTAASSMADAETYAAARSLMPGLPATDSDRVRFTCTDDAARIAALAGEPDPLASLSFDVEGLGAREAVAEDLMLAARMRAGIGSELAKRASDLMGPDFDRALDKLAHEGLLEVVDGSWRPTHRGWLLGNEVYGELWGLAE